ncbi:MAG: kinase, partial [Mycolicibacterium sp.]|nr:kinase [Mycolicibacterium sp.]
PLVVDAGRWKPVMTDLVVHATDVVCSSDFRVPGTTDSKSTAAALVANGVRTVVTTQGGDPVQWWSEGQSGSVPVEPVMVVDTLGAGDAFHGAYAYFSTRRDTNVTDRVDRSSRVAALRCSVVGPRAWLSRLSTEFHTQLTRERER